MYLLGHVGSAVLIYSIYEWLSGTRSDRNILIISIGSMLPDFLDKPIGSLIFNSGRWFGHSLLFQFVVFLTLTFIMHVNNPYNKFKTDRLLLYAGSTIHLLGDMQGLTKSTLLWPLFGPFPTGSKDGFLMGIESHFVLVTEAIGLLILVTIGIYHDWRKQYWSILGAIVIAYLSVYTIVYQLLVGF